MLFRNRISQLNSNLVKVVVVLLSTKISYQHSTRVIAYDPYNSQRLQPHEKKRFHSMVILSVLNDIGSYGVLDSLKLNGLLLEY